MMHLQILTVHASKKAVIAYINSKDLGFTTFWLLTVMSAPRTTLDVRISRLHSIPALKRLTIYNGRRST